VAVVALLLVVVMATLFTCPAGPSETDRGNGHDPATYGFVLDGSLVPRDAIVASGMPRDGLTALLEPRTLTPPEVALRNSEGRGKFLLSHDRVVGLVVGGEARAYPVRLMRWHEVVNDTVGGVPVVVTYNPLCDAVVAAERTVAGSVVEFGVSGLLYNSNLLLYDRHRLLAESSLWSQIGARAIAGPAAATGARLRLLPVALDSWGDWLGRHPDTRVLAPVERLKKLYRRDPYHSYFGSDILRFPVEPRPPEDGLSVKERVVVVSVGSTETAFALSRLAEAVGTRSGQWRTEVAEVPIAIRFDATLGTASVMPEPGFDTTVAVRHAFWFAWYAHHPETPEPGP
jgi:hypothetical protein